jgi:hypothetical protein
MSILTDTIIVLAMQVIVMIICRILSNDVKKEIQYNLMKIRAGVREITKTRAVGLLAETFCLDLITLLFLLLVCANSYRLVTYI